jgi:hypothetical protein
MSSGVRFVPNPLLEGELLRSELLAAEMRAKAEIGVAVAKAVAPVGDPATDPTSGRFRDSIHVKQEGVEVQIASDDPVAAYIEFGTEDTPAHATLRRGALAAAAAKV